MRKLNGFSSSTLPEVDITIRDADTVCEGNLELFTAAPEPRSSSEPADIDPPEPSTPPEPTGSVEITKAVYKNSKDKLVVHAKYSAGGDVELRLTVEGLVTDALMDWKAKKSCYQLKLNTPINFDGADATVSGPGGAHDTVKIR